MKKIISLVIAAVTAFCLCIPAFAAQSATFAVNVISEDDKSAVVSVDFKGGAAFNCLAFEITLSKRLSVEKSASGAGMRNFKIYVQDMGTGMENYIIMSFNDNANPMMFTFATLVGFKAVNGNDLIVLTLKKSSAGKLTADDFKLKVTNCGLSGSDATSVVPINTEVVQIGGTSNVKTSAAAGQAGTTVAKTNASARAETTTEVEATTGSSQPSGELTSVAGESVSEKSTESPTEKSTDKRKIIIVGAAALVVLAFIVAAVIVIARKAKKEDAE